MRPLAFCTLAVVLVACGSGGTGGSADTTAAAAPATQAAPAPAPAAAAKGIRLARIGSFAAPVYVTAPPGDRSRIFVVEQAGRIRVVRNGKTLARPFLDIR